MLKTNMINIDVIDCELFMSMIQKTSDLFLHWFGSQIICRVVYETMIRDGIISAEVVGQFVSVFGREPDGPAVSESIKITPPVREIIQNADDVIRYFSKTEYSHMIEQAFLM